MSETGEGKTRLGGIRAGRESQWPPAPNFPKDAFIGTARYYAQYRPPYPNSLLDDLRIRADITEEGRLLDLASGPGRVALALAPYFREVWAVDQEREMIDIGCEQAKSAGVTNVQWIVNRAEDLEAPSRFFNLITIGEAFHRLDQRIITLRTLDWLETGGSLAILWYVNFWRGNEGWQQLATDVVSKWTGRRTGTRSEQIAHPVPFKKILETYGFEHVAEYEFRVRHVWTLDALVGFLYSTSGVSKHALGDKAEDFEADFRSSLIAFDSCGQYEETARFGYLFGSSPSH